MKYNAGNNRGTILKSNIVTNFYANEKDPNKCKSTFFNFGEII